MANMIPAKPKEFDERSKEGFVFDSFKKLSDDYYVFHSVTPVGVTNDNEFYEREIDFVIAHKRKGVIAIEVKAGSRLSYVDRTWIYSNGAPMSHGGPYNQAASSKRTLINKLRNHPDPDVRDLYQRCRFYHAVCFPDMSVENFDELEGLPEEADMNITLCAEDLLDPENKISGIFDLELSFDRYYDYVEEMTDGDFNLLLREVLCPEFNMVPSSKADTIILNEHMNQLIREQYIILDFLEEQKSAVINGAAGTGKTMIAVEKARRHSMAGDKVLFLCYNKMLCESLIDENKRCSDRKRKEQFANVEFMTISKLATKTTGNFTDYEGLNQWLCDARDGKHKFKYQHIIVDEGQDFGLIDSMNIENDTESGSANVSIIDALQNIAEEKDGTFYLFYDKYQMIQGGYNTEYPLPECIRDCDCRLTLHRNCRNTYEIARTAATTLNEKRNKILKEGVSCNWDKPIKPQLYLENHNTKDTVDNILDVLEQEHIEDVIILTTGNIQYSDLYSHLENNATCEGFYHYKHNDNFYRMTTCIKYKGLEADVVILIDLKEHSFSGKSGLEFYVGASRAKGRLYLVCNLTEEEYYPVTQALDSTAPYREDIKRRKRVLANILAADLCD